MSTRAVGSSTLSGRSHDRVIDWKKFMGTNTIVGRIIIATKMRIRVRLRKRNFDEDPESFADQKVLASLGKEMLQVTILADLRPASSRLDTQQMGT